MPIGGIFSGIGSAISGGLNYEAQKEANRINKEIAEKNLEFEKQAYNEQFAYQKELNNLQMQREDNAVQRQVADRTKAGLNPLGSGAANSTALATATPKTPQNQYTQQAPQLMDLGQIATNILGAIQMQENIANTKMDRMLTQRKIATEVENKNNVKIDTLLKRAQHAKTQSEKDSIYSQIDRMKKEIDIMNYNLNKSQSLGIRTTDYMDFNSQQAIRGVKSFFKGLTEQTKEARRTAAKRVRNNIGTPTNPNSQNWRGKGGTTINGKRYGY